MASKKLTKQQQELLDFVTATDERYRAAKVGARARALAQVEREVAAFAQARDQAVYDAVQAGVPKRKVGLEGLRTSSPNTVLEAYERIANAQEIVQVELAKKHVERFTVLTRGRTDRVRYIFVGDSEAFVNPHFEGLPQVPAQEGYFFIYAVHEWIQWPNQAKEEPAPEGMLEFVLANAEES